MSYSSEVLADGPLGYWRLGELSGTAMVDSSGNGRDGTYGTATVIGEPSLVPSTADTAASANISSSNRLGQVPHGTWMNGTAFAIEFWIKCPTWRANDRVMSRDFDGTNGPWLISVDSSGRLEAIVWAGGSGAAATSSALTGGRAYHVVLEYANDGAGIQLYVDGTLAGTAAKTGTLSTTTIPLFVGGWGSGGTKFSGTLDEVALYDHRLGATRVAAHYAAATSSTAPASSTLVATLRAKAASLTSDVVALALSSTLAATLSPKAAAFTSGVVAPTGPLDSSLSVALPRKVAAFDSTVALSARISSLAGMLPPKVATFTARAIVPVTPAPEVVAQAMSVVVAKAHGPVTMQGTQPVYAVAQAETPRARQQIMVDGVDVTYFRGATTPDVTYTLLEPLLYGPGNLDLPQVAAGFETFGAGDLAWLRPQAPVEVNLVVDDVVTVRDVYRGFVAAFDFNGIGLSVELGGEANGRAAMRDRQNPIFPRINDVGHQIADAVRDLGLPHYPPLGAVTGIEMMTTGGTGHLDHINDLVAKSWTRSGKQWTVMPNPATGVYETHRKDATTIHGTVFLDAVHTVGSLRRDIAEEPNQIFVTCVTPAGMRVRFGKYPGLVQGPVPDFPGVMSFGSTGEGVRLLTGKLHASGYLKLADVAGGFDADVEEAVRQLQDDAGLLETGEVNLATWRALYDLDVTGLSLEWANIQPAAQRSKTRKYDRSANGTILGFNDEYDPDVIVRHRTIDLGSGVTRRQAREFARTVLHDSDAPNWVGDITFNTGALIRGEGAVGMSVTPADVMDARELRPGMNLWAPQFDGGTLLHVSACAPNADGIVTATVDTRFRDAMEVWQVIARNKESRNDPSRHRARRYRASTIVKDSIGEWDEFGGFLGVDLPLEAGWNKFPVVAAMEGQIRKLKVVLDNPAEFVVAAWGDEPDVGWLNDAIADPLTVAGTRAWEKKEDALDDRWLLYTGGTHQEPAGYWPGRKMWETVDGEPASSGVVTGKFVDPAGFPYFAADRKVVWVTVFVREANKISSQRIMWPQKEAGV